MAFSLPHESKTLDPGPKCVNYRRLEEKAYPVDCFAGASPLPAYERSAPGKAAAHRLHQHEMTRPNSAVRHRLGERQRHRGGRGIGVAIDGYHHLARGK